MDDCGIAVEKEHPLPSTMVTISASELLMIWRILDRSGGDFGNGLPHVLWLMNGNYGSKL